MTEPHPGPYRGRRNDYPALSEYWAKRARHFEDRAERAERERDEAREDLRLRTQERNSLRYAVERLADLARCERCTCDNPATCPRV